jgi:hypothetical protein
MKIQIRPIVKTRSSHVFFVKAEAQRLYQMKTAVCQHAGPRYVAGVLRYFRLE